MSSDVIANQPPQNPVNSPAVAGGVANPIGGRGGGTPPSIEKLKQRMYGYRERQKGLETQHQNTRDTNDLQVRYPILLYKQSFVYICLPFGRVLVGLRFLCFQNTIQSLTAMPRVHEL